VYQQETCSEELAVERKVQSAVLSRSKEADFVGLWGMTLHHLDDLTYNLQKDFAPNYTGMRRKHEKIKVRPLIPDLKEGQLPLPE